VSIAAWTEEIWEEGACKEEVGWWDNWLLEAKE
jgi:hypothetical protein